jgi:hypothetical protein
MLPSASSLISLSPERTKSSLLAAMTNFGAGAATGGATGAGTGFAATTGATGAAEPAGPAAGDVVFSLQPTPTANVISDAYIHEYFTPPT